MRQMQRLLAARGYDIGEIDGKIGPRTRHAIRSFQTARGLPVTGAVDVDLLEILSGRPV